MMKKLFIAGSVLLGLLAVACAPQSAHQARSDLATTSSAAAGAAKSVADERAKMGVLTKEIMFDVQNIKEVEAFFDQEDRTITFE